MLAAMRIGHIEVHHPAAEIGDARFQTPRALQREKLHLFALVGGTPILAGDVLRMGSAAQGRSKNRQ